MSRFDNKLCPVCRERFKEGDDIVVCPVCGTPHHRACYLKNNTCGVEEYHSNGFVWDGRLPDEPEPENISSSDDTAERIPEEDVTVESSEGDYSDFAGAENEMMKQLEQVDPSFREFVKKMRSTKKGEDDVSMRELTAYSATSVTHYGQAFGRFRGELDGKKHKVFFNFCSGLFAPVFQFYRKMDWLGFIVVALMLLPTLLLWLIPGAQNNLAFAYLIRLINVAETFVLCLFGDYFYYKHCAYKIRKIRREFGEKASSAEYYAELTERGKPSTLRGVIGFLIMTLATAFAWVVQTNII